ncbi:MAG: hypothetical protein GY750_04415 [Lentisphaerae bacterium]|nr:hypothetical protein [Lentisphaerota bacterium]
MPILSHFAARPPFSKNNQTYIKGLGILLIISGILLALFFSLLPLLINNQNTSNNDKNELVYIKTFIPTPSKAITK